MVSPQLLPTVKFTVNSEEQGNLEGKAQFLVSAEVLLACSATNPASKDPWNSRPHPVNWG